MASNVSLPGSFHARRWPGGTDHRAARYEVAGRSVGGFEQQKSNVLSRRRQVKELSEEAPERKATPLTVEQSCAPTGSTVQVPDSDQAGPSLPQSPATATRRKSGQAARRRGRLDREVLAKLGQGLKDCFADVQNQEVPERFKVLLQQF
jgi:hypothetical protein